MPKLNLRIGKNKFSIPRLEFVKEHLPLSIATWSQLADAWNGNTSMAQKWGQLPRDPKGGATISFDGDNVLFEVVLHTEDLPEAAKKQEVKK